MTLVVLSGTLAVVGLGGAHVVGAVVLSGLAVAAVTALGDVVQDHHFQPRAGWTVATVTGLASLGVALSSLGLLEPPMVRPPGALRPDRRRGASGWELSTGCLNKLTHQGDSGRTSLSVASARQAHLGTEPVVLTRRRSRQMLPMPPSSADPGKKAGQPPAPSTRRPRLR